MGFSRTAVLISVMAVLMTLAAEVVVAQGNDASCAAKLVPCADYINSTKPPPSCCGPLKEAVTKELSCLCNLYSDPGFLAQFHINATQALLLPGYCGIPGKISACNSTAKSPTSAETPPGTSGGNNNNGVDKIVGAGLSSLLLLVAASLMLF